MSWTKKKKSRKLFADALRQSSLGTVQELEKVSEVIKAIENERARMSRAQFLAKLEAKLEQEMPGYADFKNFFEGEEGAAAEITYARFRSVVQILKRMEVKTQLKREKFGLFKHDFRELKQVNWEEFKAMTEIAKRVYV